MTPTLRRPRPRSRSPLLRAARALWTLPTNLLGHPLGVLASGTLGERVGGPVTAARLYRIRLPFLRWVGGVTLGHAILLSPRLAEGQLGRLVLAHELAHTRQHDVLGPLYLPLHVTAQVISAAAWALAPVEGSDPVHAHNPLEQRWLFLGHGAIRELERGDRLDAAERESFLRDVGV